jgi:hypothetical protein
VERLTLPASLRGVFFDFLWDTRKDGYHRLARHFVERSLIVSVRLHPDRYKAGILRFS